MEHVEVEARESADDESSYSALSIEDGSQNDVRVVMSTRVYYPDSPMSKANNCHEILHAITLKYLIKPISCSEKLYTTLPKSGFIRSFLVTYF